MESILEKSKIVNILCSVAIEENGKYLLVKEAKESVQGLWNFPSGKVCLGEDILEATKREALEETGYECTITDLMSVYYSYWEDNSGITVRFNFWGKIKHKNTIDLASDVSESKWHEIQEIQQLQKNNMLRSKNTAKQLEEIIEGKRFPISTLIKL